jgi:hypothetical protein
MNTADHQHEVANLIESKVILIANKELKKM